MEAGIARLWRSELDELADGRTARIYPLILDRDDGMLSEEFAEGTPVRLRSGTLAFATTNGVALVDPASLFPRRIPSLAQIDEILVNGNPRSPTRDGTGLRLVLAPDERRVEFRYTSLLGDITREVAVPRPACGS